MHIGSASRLLSSALALLVAFPLVAQPLAGSPDATTAIEPPPPPPLEGSADALLAAPSLAAPTVRILPRLTPGTRWLRKLSYSSGLEAAVTRGESESSTRWTDTVEVEVEITLLAGGRRAPRRYDLLFRRVDQPGASEAARLPNLPSVGDRWRCEGDESWTCTSLKGEIAPPFWLLPEWSAWWFEGRLGDDGSYTRVRGVARQLGLPADARARLTVRTAGGGSDGRTELDLIPSGTIATPVADGTAAATLTGAGHLSADLDAGLIPALALQWRASAEGRLPGGHGTFRRAESHSLTWTEAPLPAAPAKP